MQPSRTGDAGPEVTELQRRLKELGYYESQPGGVFGFRTEEALRSFQRDYGINVDGACSSTTLRALEQLFPPTSPSQP